MVTAIAYRYAGGTSSVALVLRQRRVLVDLPTRDVEGDRVQGEAGSVTAVGQLIAAGVDPRWRIDRNRRQTLLPSRRSQRSISNFGAALLPFIAVLTELIPLALVVALSPLSIIPAVLVLHAPRPRPTGLTFLAGWLVGLAAVTQIFVEVSNLLGGGLDDPPSWAAYVRIVAGGALIVFGAYKWLKRGRSDHSPKWMSSFDTITPARAAVTATVLVVVNPKVLFMCAAAGLAIGTEGLGRAGATLGVLYYVAIAASTVALPVLAYAVSGDRLHRPLTRLKDWMQAQHATLVAGILIVLGLLVLYKGIHGL